jgi:hypothetical protein
MTARPAIIRQQERLVLLSAALAVAIALWPCGGATALAASEAKSLVWIPVSEFVGMLITIAVVIAVGVFLRVRMARAARQLADEPILDTPLEEDEAIIDTAIEETEVPPVAFRCPLCRRGLKAKAELAGKKVKCRQCGKPVLVPINLTARNGHIVR